MIVTARAKLRYVSIPPRKMRLVARQVKGMPVQKALDMLNFTPRIAARHVAKTLKSAAANALSQQGTDRLRPEDLVVKSVMVDAAPTAKRIRFQSMGRVFRIRKRFCHLTIYVMGEMEADATPRRGATKAKKAAEDTAESQTSKKGTKKAADQKAPAKKSVPKRTAAGKKRAAATKTTTATKAGKANIPQKGER